MPWIIDEKLKSRAGQLGESGSKTLEYFILWQGEDEPGSDAEVHALLNATAPPLWGNLPLKNTAIDPVSDILWDGRAEYGQRDTSYDSTLAFDTTGGTSHITQSIATIGRHGPGACDLRGAIGVTQDAVDGVDITIPAFAWSEGRNFPVAQVTDTYITNLCLLTGSTNVAQFKQFQPGEVLFLGASGRRENFIWNLEFKFVSSPNRSNFQIAGINVTRKRGHDYLWCQYRPVKVPGTDGALRMWQRVQAVYVEQVYPEKDFSLLGLGV
jgi:hypothetical protein